MYFLVNRKVNPLDDGDCMADVSCDYRVIWQRPDDGLLIVETNEIPDTAICRIEDDDSVVVSYKNWWTIQPLDEPIWRRN